MRLFLVIPALSVVLAVVWGVNTLLTHVNAALQVVLG